MFCDVTLLKTTENNEPEYPRVKKNKKTLTTSCGMSY